ncbi:type II toxin-antitoxin system HicB family antitoxin [Paraburkholderia sp. C35]|uniref:type II toxin-antitoxin system HicB family antitoxin n=1 Tax=Paraburkholderia sp. C35 TaxID=2126993 RepID=UPI000D6904B0|nr:type II toxin-antitoxin system HicB family antitoxin [Paraburkholderia sp. C35]
MKFPIAIHKDPGSSYGVTVPDFPGCFSSGDSIEQAIESTLEAIEGWVEVSIESGDEVKFEPTPVEQLRDNPDYAGAIWAMVDVDPTKFDTKPERVNISVPRFVLVQIDAYAESHKETRSGFLVRAALEKMREGEAHA